MENAWKWEIKVESILSKLLRLAIEYFAFSEVWAKYFFWPESELDLVITSQHFYCIFHGWKNIRKLKINIKMITGR